MFPTADALASMLAGCCMRAFPERTVLQVTGPVDITTGWGTEVHALDVEYEERGERRREGLILRIYPTTGAAERAAREFNALRRLQRVGYPVPAPLLLVADNAPQGRPSIIMERIEARPLSEVMDAAPEPRKQQLVTLLCRLAVDLHRLDWRPFVPDPARYGPDTILAEQVVATRRTVERFGKPEFGPVVDWLEARLPRIHCERLSVIHGDYHPANILSRADGSAVVIDWQDLSVSDYRNDLAWTLLLAHTYDGPALRARILAGYAQMAGRPVEHIEVFEAAAMLRRLFTVSVMASDGAAALGMRPGAEAMLAGSAENVGKVHALLRESTGIRIAKVDELVAALA